MSTNCPRCHSLQIHRSRRYGNLESGLLSILLLQPFRCDNCNHRFFRWSFAANAAQSYQAISRNIKRIETAVLRKKRALVSFYLSSRAAMRVVARVPKPYAKITRIILIKEDTPLPPTISMESEAFLPGWRVLRNLDRQALTREVKRDRK